MKKKKFFVAVLLCIFVGLIFGQNTDVVILDAKNGNIDGVVRDLVLDRNVLHLKSVSILNASYIDFGVRSNAISFYGANPWFDDPETYAFFETQTMRNHNFKFWFRPLSSDRDGRRYMMDLDGNYYTSPQRVNINGKFFMVKIPGTVVLGFLVESFEILGKTYGGVLPSTILDPTHPEHWGKRIF